MKSDVYKRQLQSFCFAFETILWGEASRRRPLSILTPLALASIALAGLLALTCANVLDKGIVSGLVCLLPVVDVYKRQRLPCAAPRIV